jgi:TM2 domain-containing membrane protein YozV
MYQSTYCPSCGFENRSNARFCKQCGAAMATALPPVPQAQPAWSPAPQPMALPFNPLAASTATAWLVAPAAGQRYPLSTYTTIGRGPGNTIVLTDSSVSTEHAIITENGGQWQINDNNSRNGTSINRARIAAPCALRSGDEVMLGTLALRFETDLGPNAKRGGTTWIEPAPYPAPIGQAGPDAQPAGGTSMPDNSRNKVTAGILAILLGGVGAHKFYLGKYAQGVVYLLFSWTGIPMVIGIIEGVIYLGMSDVRFAQKYG